MMSPKKFFEGEGGHQKVTTGDKGGGRGQKSQNGGDVIYERPPK